MNGPRSPENYLAAELCFDPVLRYRADQTTDIVGTAPISIGLGNEMCVSSVCQKYASPMFGLSTKLAAHFNEKVFQGTVLKTFHFQKKLDHSKI